MRINFGNTAVQGVSAQEKKPSSQKMSNTQLLKMYAVSGGFHAGATFGLIHIIEKTQRLKIKNKGIIAACTGLAAILIPKAAYLIAESTKHHNKK